jgi:malonyl-CoA/methylmalonyl-CoA synthetase
MLTLFENVKKNLHNIAIQSGGKSYAYETLLNASSELAHHLMQDTPDLKEARVAFIVDPGFDYVKSLWAIWQAGGVAVPLCITHPLPALEYVLEDTGASIILLSRVYQPLLQPYLDKTQIRFIILEEMIHTSTHAILPDIDPARMALILYTSGTTNKPKGVVTTHFNIESQIDTLVHSWEWTKKDHTICVLPLHHVHGIINVVGCSLWVGATCIFVPQFSPAFIFELFEQEPINVFMAVPTIYFKLITYLESVTPERQQALKEIMQKFRLMVCGSAALPVSVMEKWAQLSGQVLLERYGMTELGMAISNPYHGERKPGHVGFPLNGVEVRLVNENEQVVPTGEQGEIIVKGNNVFKEYWQKPDATAASFTKDGWFKTGDIAIVENGYYKILGRSSIDIIKSGGYKISALEIEEVLRQNEMLEDCAVVGIDNEEWGELIVAAILLKKEFTEVFNETSLTEWFVQRMASYKKPRKYLILEELPRNAMGKVVKNEVKKLF